MVSLFEVWLDFGGQSTMLAPSAVQPVMMEVMMEAMMVTDERGGRGEENAVVDAVDAAAADDDRLAQARSSWKLACHMVDVDVGNIEAVSSIDCETEDWLVK